MLFVVKTNLSWLFVAIHFKKIGQWQVRLRAGGEGLLNPYLEDMYTRTAVRLLATYPDSSGTVNLSMNNPL